MLSWWWLKPKWIKHVAEQVGFRFPSSWNVTLYLQFKRSFSFFFYPISNLPHQSFLEPIQPKMTMKWSKCSKVSWFWDPERTLTSMPAAFNIAQTRLKFLTMALWWKPHDLRITTPTYIQPFQCWHFSFPININFGWPCKSVIHPYQHKYWNILLLDFHYHTIHIKFPNIDSFLSI